MLGILNIGFDFRWGHTEKMLTWTRVNFKHLFFPIFPFFPISV